MESLAVRLRRLREGNQKTQKEIANIIGTTQGAYAHWENGTREPNLETLNKLKEYYKVSLDYLVGAADWNTYTEDKDTLLKNLEESGYMAYSKSVLNLKEHISETMIALRRGKITAKDVNKHFREQLKFAKEKGLDYSGILIHEVLTFSNRISNEELHTVLDKISDTNLAPIDTKSK